MKSPILRLGTNRVENKQPSYRKQIARQLRTQYVEGIYSNSVTLKSMLGITEGR